MYAVAYSVWKWSLVWREGLSNWQSEHPPEGGGVGVFFFPFQIAEHFGSLEYSDPSVTTGASIGFVLFA